MRMRSSILGSLVIGLILAGVGLGCDRDRADDASHLTGGELVYEAEFDDGEIGTEWRTGFDGWGVVDGEIHAEGARNDALWLQEPLPDAFRVSFTARSESEEGDIKFEILGDGETHESGYVGIFGGWNNQLNIIARLDEHGEDRLVGADGHSVEPGRTYQMDVVRTDHRLRWYVDGDLFLAYDDANPLRGDEHRYFGFNNWEAPLYFDEVRIYDLQE